MSSLLSGQSYRWPIRASQSLSATFSEYRSGHLHAGIDIKTWGEMEVPCLAIGDGYIERISIGYNGYGKGVWLRLYDGNVAVYGHLEQFTPVIESLIRSEQLERDRYSMRLEFAPNEHPVKAGAVIGYSGTSGTEHPHLHFEIRDSLRQVHNPQLFYTGIKDVKPPILDEILLIPLGIDSQIDGSRFPVVFDMQTDIKTVSVTGPFQVAINTHDRANGTYNKYNIFSATLLVNDSLMFAREFDQVARRLADDVDKVYPGLKGKRGWRFMSMYNSNLKEAAPFAPESLSGKIFPAGLSHLQVEVTDLVGNQVTKSLIFHETAPATWDLKREGERYVITRHFSENGYENIQFYTGNNSYIPVTETLYRLKSTTWVLGDKNFSSGVRALGTAGAKIKWIIPPKNQGVWDLTHNWRRKGNGFILKIESGEPLVFPLAYSITGNQLQFSGELIQTNPTTVESDIIPINHAAQAENIDLIIGKRILTSLALSPMQLLSHGQTDTFNLDMINAGLSVKNSGSSELYLKIDTTMRMLDEQPLIGLVVSVLNTPQSNFSGQLRFDIAGQNSGLSIFSPGKKETWKRQISADSTKQYELEINEGGSFFLFEDSEAPTITSKKSFSRVRRGERLVFTIRDNTGIVSYPRTGIRATLDGSLFFPDYNPLRHELSFQVPKRLGSGQHIFEFSIGDESGNMREFKHTFSVKS
ncbi:MAG: M23 family metallopeptidase [Candidatus Marinimicrobia bacterium]|jgi:hypothetical protein|nr:M23 family metallopeptidase [Candidatus Neomarinimicrobiota bacterium]